MAQLSPEQFEALWQDAQKGPVVREAAVQAIQLDLSLLAVLDRYVEVADGYLAQGNGTNSSVTWDWMLTGSHRVAMASRASASTGPSVSTIFLALSERTSWRELATLDGFSVRPLRAQLKAAEAMRGCNSGQSKSLAGSAKNNGTGTIKGNTTNNFQ